VPKRIYTLGVNEKLNDKWRVGATLIGQSSSFVDTTNSEKMGSYALVNTTVGYKINATTHIDLQIRNLTNRTYYYAYDNVYAGSPGNFYAANMPRSVFASVTAKF
ncbi:MAG: TonB-dependent receptor, partial [Pseudomonadota bacterium]|jgi:iron complex outermembrane receptor protein